MADRLTQLQDCLDQLLTQMYASLRYINTYHSYSRIPGQPDMNPHTQPTDPDTTTLPPTNGPSTSTGDPSSAAAPSQPTETSEPLPASPEEFNAALHELARDLVLKEQQIEYLISVLPGIGKGEEEQERRVRELEGLLREVEGERVRAGEEREGVLRRVEGVLAALR